MEQGKAKKLRDRILQDAGDETLEIVREGEAEAAGITDEAKARAAEITGRAEKRSVDEASEHIRRQISIRELDARKALLAEKGKFMDEAFEKAIDAVRRKDVESGYALTRSLLLQEIKTGDEEIILSPEDKKAAGASFLADLNKELKSKGLKGEVAFTEETHSARGGFILKSGRKEINATYEAMLETIRDDVEIEVSDVLFKEAK